MVRQCPRCWDKVSPEDTKCPNCGYDFVNRPAPSAKKVRTQEDGVPEKRHVVFPMSKKDKDKQKDTTLLYKISFVLTLIWAVIAILGGIVNLANGEYLQGAGFLGAGVASAIAFMHIRMRERNMLVCILILVSGALTLQIALLIVSVIVAATVYYSGKCYHSR